MSDDVGVLDRENPFRYIISIPFDVDQFSTEVASTDKVEREA